MRDFDSLWNFGDPAGTESKFRERLPAARSAQDPEYLAELLTQIARTQGLQQHYPAALATLNEADALIQPHMRSARVRSLLERGRVLNSSGKAEESLPLFTEALGHARDARLEFYAVDAAHMLGIAAKGEDALKWNLEAIALAEASTEPRARRWLGSLYNNTGWTWFDMGRYAEALALFEKDLEFYSLGNSPVEAGIARWAIGKVQRHLGRVEEALKLQQELLNDPNRQNNDSEGYTHEEIAECLLLLGRRAESRPHFARAWELLREDPWLRQDEPHRLERLKSMSLN